MKLSSVFATLSVLGNAQGQVRQIFQAPDGIALENIAVRRNGDVLFNGIGTNATFVLSFKDGKETISQLPAISDINGRFGITEINEDIFIVSAGLSNPGEPLPAPGSSVTYAYDFNKDPVAISKVANVPEAVLLNGAATIPPRRLGENGTALFSDTITGQIFHIDPTTGRFASIFRAEANSTNPAPAFVRPGVNGYEYVPRLQTLFFANTGPILGITSEAALGSVKLNIRYNRTPLPTITSAGPAKIFGPELPVDDATQFGRRREDRNTLYITSLGGFVSGTANEVKCLPYCSGPSHSTQGPDTSLSMLSTRLLISSVACQYRFP
ncbi:hypothetical protein KVT40_009276 [Elsinoe batatas]|uniref:Uncharacterized protein n=1 Tax=Elsinoe batatas TaxID=2601811 RepID=A0A8K0KVL1_9PEZI|nr:hypothetical protein KVT40_009276 [Elsinoe batatas]